MPKFTKMTRLQQLPTQTWWKSYELFISHYVRHYILCTGKKVVGELFKSVDMSDLNIFFTELCKAYFKCNKCPKIVSAHTLLIFRIRFIKSKKKKEWQIPILNLSTFQFRILLQTLAFLCKTWNINTFTTEFM